jgi:hypothetical protein
MTSIEWLASKLSVTFNTMYAAEIEQAKEMEKQQIIDAFISGVDDSLFEDDAKLIADNYYQETFKKY